MSQWVTLSKSSPEFESYLMGTFSDQKRALPIQTLNVNSSEETVTFKVVSVEDIPRPDFLSLILQVFKLRSFVLVLLPLFLILTKNVVDKTMKEPMTAIIATVGVLFAFVAVNLRNDYMDHMKGIDRVLHRSGSRAIQKGWVTAAQIKSYSSIFLLFSILLALPIVFAFPEVSVVIAIATVVGIWAQFKKQNSFKYQIGGELALFLMMGPLLTAGYQLAMGAPFDWESVWIGCVWGWLVLFLVHLRNFTQIFPSGQAGFTNTVTWLGFDRTRGLLAFWWLLFLIFNLTYHVLFAGLYWGVYLALAMGFLSMSFFLKIKQISSPVGSELRGLFKMGFRLFLIAAGLWVFECLWYLEV